MVPGHRRHHSGGQPRHRLRRSRLRAGQRPVRDPVSAVDDQGTRQTKDDLRTDWSSRGTTQDGHAKPDLYAPGARMVSNLAPGSDFASMCPDCVSGDGQYIRAGGTSMSAPVVAGVVATIL